MVLDCVSVCTCIPVLFSIYKGIVLRECALLCGFNGCVHEACCGVFFKVLFLKLKCVCLYSARMCVFIKPICWKSMRAVDERHEFKLQWTHTKWS